MVNYPIFSPVASGMGNLVHLGAMERSLTPALEAFSNSQTGLSVPEIGGLWRGVTQTPLSARTGGSFATTARRMAGAAEMLGQHYRDAQSRMSPDATVRITLGHSDDEMRLDQRRQRELFQEMAGSLSGATRTTLTPGKPLTWYLGLKAQGLGASGAVFVNEDGRCVHLSNFYADSVLLGCGWLGAMHYLEISPTAPLGKSRALFVKDQEYRTELSPTWLTNLARSLHHFYSPQTSPLSGKIRISGLNRQKVKFEATADLANDAALNDAFKQFGSTGSLVIETEETISGRRGSTLNAVNAVVPLAKILCNFEEGQWTIGRSYYLPERSIITGEAAIPEDYRKRLRFPLNSPR